MKFQRIKDWLRPQLKFRKGFFQYQVFSVAYGGFLLAQVIEYSYDQYLGLPQESIQLAFAYLTVFWFFVLSQLFSKLNSSITDLFERCMDMNDEIFKENQDLAARLRYQITLNSMRE